MQALVLVGGEGTRLRPLTATVPKPVVPLAGRPLITYMIDWLGAHGVDEVILACGFLPDALRETLGEGPPGGPRLRYLTEPRPLGTAGAIRFAADLLEERFLALNGDVLADLDLTSLLRAHEARGARATLGLVAVGDATAYGLVRTTSAGEVTEFLEKPDEGAAGGEVNAGTYVLERSVLEEIEPGRAVSIEHDVFPRLVGDGLFAMTMPGYWLDIGTPDRYLEATWDILEGRVRTGIETSSEGLLVDASAEIDPGASIGPRAVVSPGCRIAAGAEIRGSVLLRDCELGAGAVVVDSILSPGVAVEAGARLEGAVLGEGERVSA
ncbi:MAG: sugar phosphate nucleotidyltransferase [Solirubrobacterales bacterium]